MKSMISLFLLLISFSAFAETSSTDLEGTLPHVNQFSFEYGMFTNANYPNTLYKTTEFLGAGIRYARSLVDGVLLNRSSIRDSLTIAEIFEPYFYAGAMKNFTVAQTWTSDAAEVALATLQPAFGIGLAVMSHSFLARADFGYDMYGAGIGYQF